VNEDLRAEVRRLRRQVRRLRLRLERQAPSLDVLLHHRGFRIFKKEPSGDLLLPPAPFLDGYYGLLRKYSFRLFLRDVIKHQDRFTAELLTRYSTVRTVRGYIGRLVEMELAEGFGAGWRLIRRPVLSFGPTLEWFVAELLRREFGAETSWSVKFKRPKVGGDYDVLAGLDGSLLYAEVKSSPPKQIYDSEVAAFLDRVNDLAPDIAVFLMDTELRMKDKLVPMFEKALAARTTDPPPVQRLERELFEINGRIFIVNAKESIGGNLEAVISKHFRNGGRPRSGRG
jgi:hypothetical protein